MKNESDLSRRAFVTTAFVSGFALATQPVAAQTVVKTDDQGLTTENVHLKTTNGPLGAFVAMPAKAGAFPIILVVQEIFGVHEHIRDVCRRFAKLGAMAIAPDLFARHADVTKMSSIDEIRPVVARVPDAQVMSDLDAAVAFAEASGKAAKNRLGVTGFCWGGRITWLYSAHNPKVGAGVAWYGKLVGDATSHQPRHPLDVARALKPAVLGLYGGADQGIPLDTVERMRAGLKEAKSKSEIVVYPDAPHAFFADYRPSYRQAPAEDGWRRAQAWFKKHGVLA